MSVRAGTLGEITEKHVGSMQGTLSDWLSAVECKLIPFIFSGNNLVIEIKLLNMCIPFFKKTQPFYVENFFFKRK